MSRSTQGPISGERRAGRMQSRVVPALALLVVALGMAALVSRATSFSPEILAHNDLTQDYVSSRAWTDGIDPYTATAELATRYLGEDARSYRVAYENRRNPHPPIEIVLVRPFGWLGYRAARAAWLTFTSLCILLSVAVVLRDLGFRRLTAVVGGCGAIALPVVQQDMIYGQINGVILLLLVFGWRELRRGHDVRSGLALGIASALKFYPLIFVIPLLRLSRHKAFRWQLVTAIATSGIGVLLVGLHATETYLQTAAPENLRYWRAAPMNLSLVSAPFRWLTDSVWRQPSLDLVTPAIWLAVFVLGACMVAAARTPAHTSADRYWAVVPWMLLATPLSWSFTIVLALPYVIVIGVRGLRSRGLPHPAVLIPMVIVIATPIPGLPLPGPGNSILTILLGYGLPTYALLWIGMAEWRRDLHGESAAS